MKSLLMLLIGAALAVVAAGSAWRHAPLTTHATDITALMAAAVEPDVRELAREAHVVRVWPAEIASVLHVGANVKSSIVRAMDAACVSGDKPASACGKDPWLRVTIQSIPFRILAFVTVTSRNGIQEKVLLWMGGQWKIVGTRGYAV